MDKGSVIRSVNDAFAGVTLGSGIGLWQAQAIDDYEPESVQRKERQRDEKNDWKAIQPVDLQRCYSSLSFFDAEGMRFHLPAFILAEIQGKIDEFSIFHLTQLDEYAQSKLTLLNQAQKRAVTQYLNWCLEQDEYRYEQLAIERAVDEFWIKPCK